MNTNATHEVYNEGDGDLLIVTIALKPGTSNADAWTAIEAYVDQINASRPAWDELRTKGGVLTPKDNGVFRAVITLK